MIVLLQCAVDPVTEKLVRGFLGDEVADELWYEPEGEYLAAVTLTEMILQPNKGQVIN